MQVLRRHAFRLTLMSASALAIAAVPSVAQAQVRTFDIPAQPLSAALLEFSRQSNVLVMVAPETVAGFRSSEVRGALPLADALARLLRGTNLRAVSNARGGYRIERDPQSDATSGESEAGSAAADDGSAEIVVTGSNIRGVPPVGAPVIRLSAEDMRKRGRVTIAEALRTLPANTQLGVNENQTKGPQQIGNVNFGYGVNLRGLGVDATLVLVNGHRIAPAGIGAYYDVSQVPAVSLERVEILLDGASAIYGSDAVAGVVNIITRKDSHPETALTVGFADGYKQVRASQGVGLAWGSGSVRVGYEYYKRDNLDTADRPYYTQDLRPYGGPDLRTTASNPGTIIVGSTTYAIPSGQNGVGLSPAALVAGTSNKSDQQTGADVLPRQERHSVAVNAEQTLLAGVTVSLDGFFSRRAFVNRGGGDKKTIVVPRSNPFFVNPNPAATTTSVAYNFLDDLGPITQEGAVTDFSVTGSLAIELPMRWRFDMGGTIGKDRSDIRSRGGRANTALLNAALADTNPATAFNPFGDGSNTNPDTLRKIIGYTDSIYTFDTRIASAQLSGPLLDLPGGSIRLAMGGEYRTEKLVLATTSFLSAATPSSSLASLDRKVKAAYAELFVPIVGAGNAFDGVQSLSFSAAVRHENYSDFGATTNPRFGIRWIPAGGVTLNASLGYSFKAPRLFQLREAPGNPGYLGAVVADPLSSTGTSQVIELLGNNAGLQPEKSRSATLSLSLKPDAIPGFAFSLGFYDIRYTDRIVAFNSTIASFLTNPTIYQQLVTRDPSLAEVNALLDSPYFTGAKPAAASVKAILDGRLRNVGKLHQGGVDVDASYAFEMGLGTLRLDASASFILVGDQNATAESPTANILNTIGNPVDTRARLSGEWTSGGFSVLLAGNFVPGYKNTQILPVQKVSSWQTADLQLGYSFPESPSLLGGTQLTLDMQNIFDSDPPFLANVSGQYGYDPEESNALGRVISLSIRKQF